MGSDVFVILVLIAGILLLFYYQTWTIYAFLAIVAFVIFYIFFIKKYDEFERE